MKFLIIARLDMDDHMVLSFHNGNDAIAGANLVAEHLERQYEVFRVETGELIGTASPGGP